MLVVWSSFVLLLGFYQDNIWWRCNQRQTKWFLLFLQTQFSSPDLPFFTTVLKLCCMPPLSFISSLTYQKMKNKKNLISSLIYPLSPVISSQIKDFIFSLTTVRGIQIQRKVILRSAWSFFPTYLNWTHTALFLKNNFYQP